MSKNHSTLTGRHRTNKIDGRQNILVLQHESERPTAQLHRHDHLGPKAQQERHGDERLHGHQPRRQQPFADHVVLVAEHVVAAVEELVVLEVRVAELVEAVLPQAHVLEAREGLLEALHPVGTERSFCFCTR